jgi:hypothetical protein
LLKHAIAQCQVGLVYQLGRLGQGQDTMPRISTGKAASRKQVEPLNLLTDYMPRVCPGTAAKQAPFQLQEEQLNGYQTYHQTSFMLELRMIDSIQPCTSIPMYRWYRLVYLVDFGVPSVQVAGSQQTPRVAGLNLFGSFGQRDLAALQRVASLSAPDSELTRGPHACLARVSPCWKAGSVTEPAQVGPLGPRIRIQTTSLATLSHVMSVLQGPKATLTLHCASESSPLTAKVSKSKKGGLTARTANQS